MSLTPPRRVCLDLNILFSALIARAKGVRTTSRQLYEWALAHDTPGGPIDLVIDAGMLDLLEEVAVMLGVTSDEAAEFRRSLEEVVLAAAHRPGLLVLVGSGAVIGGPDDEDAGVLEVAVAGQADLLVTRNLRDFRRLQDVRPAGHPEHFRYEGAGHRLDIVSPLLARHWLARSWGAYPPRSERRGIAPR